MVDVSTTVAPVRRLWSNAPAAVRIGILYVAARVVTTVFFVLAGAMAPAGSRFGPDASFGELAVGWDATWYWYVAVNGYPSMLPLTDAGLVGENQWAFMPVYAYLASWLGALFGSWIAGAVVISMVAGYGASYVLYRMLRMRLDRSAATWGALFFAAGPLAGLFQVGYAETLFLFMLFLALWLVMRRSYAWLYVLIPVMGFTRPGILAFSLFLALFGIWRWFRRRQEPLPTREIVHIIALGLIALVVGFSWQGIAGIVTGDAGAYLATELAWRRNWIPGFDGHFFPFDGFIAATEFWAGQWGWPVWLGYIALVTFVGAAVLALLFAPQVRALGIEIRLWSASYLLYILAVFFPQSSIFRLLVPISPLWGALAVPRYPAWRIGVLVAGLAGQWWWIYNMYGLGSTIFQIP